MGNLEGFVREERKKIYIQFKYKEFNIPAFINSVRCLGVRDTGSTPELIKRLNCLISEKMCIMGVFGEENEYRRLRCPFVRVV